MIVLFTAVFIGMQYFRTKSEPTPPPQQQKQSAPIAPLAAPAAASSATGQPGAALVEQASAASETVVENELYRIRFSNRGAQVVSWVLKRYKDDAGRPLDMVNPETAAKYGYPLSLYTYDASLRDRLSQALFVPSATGTVTSPGEITFTYSDGTVTARKSFRFDTSYVVHATAAVTVDGAAVTSLLAWPAGFGDQETVADFANSHFDTMQNGKSNQDQAKKVSGGATLNGPFDWAGVSDLYFAAIFLPDAPQQASLVGLHNQIQAARKRPLTVGSEKAETSVLGAAMGDISGRTSLRLYVGPKQLDVLSSVHATPTGGLQSGPSIEPVVSFGWWGVISKPLFLVLRWIRDHIVPNWGWAILILTLIINVLMLPTRVTMMKSALKMQRIQPQMEAIKEKYKKYKATDPRRQDMNKEMFELQRREGASMFGGCLPMLIQWPLLFGFYRMLSNVIELRQAHWLWLPDLSQPDPFHILPIFFIVSMFLVQFLTPSPGVDPAQQRMMAFTMPAVFGFMTWNIGSGLALYWACGNIISIVTQLVMNRTKLGREMRAIAAKRAAKRTQR